VFPRLFNDCASTSEFPQPRVRRTRTEHLVTQEERLNSLMEEDGNSRSLVEVYRHFGEIYRLCLLSRTVSTTRRQHHHTDSVF